MKIVGVHGIAQTFVCAETLKQIWLPALRDGLAEAGWRQLGDNDFEVVAYGPLFRPGEFRSTGTPKIHSEDLDDWECEMLAVLWQEASRLSEQSAGEEKEESP